MSRSRSRSRSLSRVRSSPRRRDDRWRSRSPPRKSYGSPRRRYSQSPDRRSGHSLQRRISRSPRRNFRKSPLQRPSRSPRQRLSRSPLGRGRDPNGRLPSRSPERRPSRSPPRRRYDDRRKENGGGFRWKDKGKDHERFDKKDDGRLERGYRDQEKKRARSPTRDTAEQSAKNAGKPTEKPKKEKKAASTITAPVNEAMIIVNVNNRLGTKAAVPCLASDPISTFSLLSTASFCTTELCSFYFLELFKAQVAAIIGRQPHEIMLKRQGERPFKDQLTLQDYGVSNGVQLDL